jgi:hypothetical protein
LDVVRHSWVLLLVASGVAVLQAGCGDSLNLAPTTGTVTYNGKPVEGANVTFVPEKGPIGTGTTDAAGKYSITTDGKPGAIVGKHGVMIGKFTAVEGTTETATPEDMMKMASKMGKGAASLSNPGEIPAKYGTTQGSGLSADVAAGSDNVKDFTLTD